MSHEEMEERKIMDDGVQDDGELIQRPMGGGVTDSGQERIRKGELVGKEKEKID